MLPFEPVTITFQNVQYYVNMPTVNFNAMKLFYHHKSPIFLFFKLGKTYRMGLFLLNENHTDE